VLHAARQLPAWLIFDVGQNCHLLLTRPHILKAIVRTSSEFAASGGVNITKNRRFENHLIIP
jgi:hypothetical protein